jgi:tRNA U54 and U55 pseudouridine synthase Pus10
VRERWVEFLSFEPDEDPAARAGTLWRVRLRTQHGTYVKEVLSGEAGRTQPSLASLVAAPCRCLELDVLAILDEEGRPEEARPRPSRFGAGLE